MEMPVHTGCLQAFKSSQANNYDYFGKEVKISPFKYIYRHEDGHEELPGFDNEALIERALLHDDEVEFVEMVDDIKDDKELLERTLDRMFELDAVNCVTAVLDGKTEGKFDFSNQPLFAGCSQLPLLHLASLHSSVGITELLLRRDPEAAGVDYVAENDEFGRNMLPLNVVLRNTGLNEALDYSTPKESIFRLFCCLCHPNERRNLEVARLLAQRTVYTQEEFFYYVELGDIIKVAALMMVAREEVIPVKDADKIQALIAEMVAALDAIQNLPFYGVNTDFLKVLKRKEQLMKMMLLLFDIFERVNNAFSAYIQLDPQGVDSDQVAVHIACLFRTAGLSVPEEYIRGPPSSSSYEHALMSSEGVKPRVDGLDNFKLRHHMYGQTLQGVEGLVPLFKWPPGFFQQLAPFGNSASYHTLSSVEACKGFGSSAQVRKMGHLKPNAPSALLMTTLKRGMRYI